MAVHGGSGLTEARAYQIAQECAGGGGPHSHAIADVTDLQEALGGKQAAGAYAGAEHNHDASYAPLAHGHTITGVIGLQGELDSKQPAGSYAPASHTHDYEAAGAIAAHTGAGDPHPQYLTQAEGDARYLGQGGADPWAYIKSASDFTTSSAAAVDVAGLAFTPQANKQYEFEALLLCRTATATVGPRPGLAWPTGGADGVADIAMPTSATAQVLVFGNIGAALLAAVGGLPNTTQSYPARVRGTFRAGASPSGAVKVQMASETAGTNVTVKAGSFLKYREI